MSSLQRNLFDQLIARKHYILAIQYWIFQMKKHRLFERRAYVRSRGMADNASRAEIIRLLRDDRLAAKYLKTLKKLDVKIQKTWS